MSQRNGTRNFGSGASLRKTFTPLRVLGGLMGDVARVAPRPPLSFGEPNDTRQPMAGTPARFRDALGVAVVHQPALSLERRGGVRIERLVTVEEDVALAVKEPRRGETAARKATWVPNWSMERTYDVASEPCSAYVYGCPMARFTVGPNSAGPKPDHTGWLGVIVCVRSMYRAMLRTWSQTSHRPDCATAVEGPV